MIRVLVAFLMLSGAAQAGAWDEFKARCLVPMENLDAPKINDLTPYEVQLREDMDGFPAGEDLVVYVSRDPDVPNKCRPYVSDKTLAREFMIEARAHFKAEVNAGRYLIVKEAPAGWVLHSNAWREPVLSIEIGWMRPEWTSLVVKETDLES